MAALMTFAIAAFNQLVPPANPEQAWAIQIYGCFWSGVAIGKCLRLIYHPVPEKPHDRR